MSFKNYAAYNKIAQANKKPKIEEPEEVLEESNLIKLDSILNSTPTQKEISKEMIPYPHFGTITGAQSLSINFYDLGNLIQEYEKSYPDEGKKLA